MTPDWSPSSTGQSRRSFMQTAVAAFVGAGTAALAGCTTETAPEAGTTAWPVDERLDYLPNRITMASYYDVETVLNDEGVETLVDALYASNASGPNTFAGQKAEFDKSVPVSLEGLDDAVSFGRMGPSESQYYGHLLVAEWDESAMVATVEEFGGRSLSAESYAGKPLYVPEVEDEEFVVSPAHLGVVDDGIYAVGHEDAVRETLGVAGGDVAPVGGQFRSTIHSARPGPIQFALDVPESAFEDARADSDEPLSPAMLQDVTDVYGSAYRDEDIRGVSVTLDVVDTGAARDIADGVEGMLGLAADKEGPPATIAANTETRLDGSTVTMVYEATLDELDQLAAEIESQSASDSGGNSDTGGSEPPLRVVEATGTVTPDGVGGIDLELQLNGETERVDFTEARGVFANIEAEIEHRLVHASNDEAIEDREHEPGRFGTEPADVLDEPGESVTLTFNLGADTDGYDVAPFGEEISAGAGAFCLLDTPSGTFHAELRVPGELDGETVDLTVEQR